MTSKIPDRGQKSLKIPDRRRISYALSGLAIDTYKNGVQNNNNDKTNKGKDIH